MAWMALGWSTAVAAQTLPLPPGAGFVWEQVGEAPFVNPSDLTFDDGGTLWDSDRVKWLDMSSGFPGVWVTPTIRFGDAILALGPHPAGGPARSDTVLRAVGLVARSTNGGATWVTVDTTGGDALYLVPAGHTYAGRILAGQATPYSDDRGATWRHPVSEPVMSVFDLISLPPPALLPGAASGRDVAAPPGWPEGRIVGGGSQGLIYSDDGGETYFLSGYTGFGHHVHHVDLVRRPDAHPLGPGPRLIALRDGAASGVVVYTSDDGGATWQQGMDLVEPNDGGVAWRAGRGLHALSEPGEADPGAGGRALAALGRGHLYQTEDGGETWQVVGRAPEMLTQPNGVGAVNSTELGPDGRLYVAVSGNGQPRWVWRTAAPVVVAETESAPPAQSASVGIRPNPAAGRVEIVVTLARAGDTRVSVVDALGREVAVVSAGLLPAGATVIPFAQADWLDGLYIVRVEARGRVTSARMTVVR